MAFALPDKMSRALDSLSLPDSDKQKNEQLARIQQLQICHHLEYRNDRPQFLVDLWWTGSPRRGPKTVGSVSLIYSLFVARQFLVRCMYNDGPDGRVYDPTKITDAQALGTRFDLAVAKHVFDFFYNESTQRWQLHAAENGTPIDLEHETQFLHGLWEDVVPEEHSYGHAHIAQLMEQLTSESQRRFGCDKAPFPHNAVKLSQDSAIAYAAGRASQATLSPSMPTVFRGGAA